MWTRLRRRPVDLYILYRSLSLTWAFVPFQVFYLQDRGLDLSAALDLNVFFTLAAACFEVPTGVFADRSGRRVAMSLSGVIMAGACALFIVGNTFAMFAWANVFAALSMTLASGADSAYLYDHLASEGRADDYPRYEGLATAAKGIGSVVAILIGGLIYAVAPWGVFALTGVCTLVAAFLAYLLAEPSHAPRATTPLEDLARASRTLVSDARLLVVLGFGATTFVLLRLSLFADQPHLESHMLRVSTSQLIVAAALLAAAKEIGGAPLASASGTLFRRFRISTLAATLAVFVVASYAVMGLSRGVFCVATMIALSSSFGLFSPLMRALMNRLIETSADRATLLSFESMARRTVFAAASPLFGRAVEASSLHAAFTGTAYVACVVFAGIALAAFVAFRQASAAQRGNALPGG